MKNAIIGLGVFLLMAAVLFVPRKAWALPARANPYAADIAAAERNNEIPPLLLGRLLWQESRFRPDIIEGRTVSSAGAIGIAQIVPRWHPNVDPYNAQDSIYYAAGYLRRLFDRFGSWEKALAAYNWGQGNLNRIINQYGRDWVDHLPTETKNYVAGIGGDILTENNA